MQNYQAEYDDYKKKAEEIKDEALKCASPHKLSQDVIQLEGYCLRVGEIISELSVLHAQYFDTYKTSDETDRTAEAMAVKRMDATYQTSLKKYEYFYKYLTKLTQAIKKRFQIIAHDYVNGKNGGGL
jgi:hypothetical protein